MIEIVGFDGDDTLWHSEGYYQQAHADFEAIVGRYVDVAEARVRERLLEMERANTRLFGYGVKAMTLSLMETGIALTDARISGADMREILAIGKAVFTHPVELLPGMREAVRAVAARHRVVLITKGDLIHQERKVAQSGLASLFERIEIVSEKDDATYRRVLRGLGIEARHFAMVGNSLRSDIEPVVALGGWGVYMPYHVTWAHEADTGFDAASPRVMRVAAAEDVAPAVQRLDESGAP